MRVVSRVQEMSAADTAESKVQVRNFEEER